MVCAETCEFSLEGLVARGGSSELGFCGHEGSKFSGLRILRIHDDRLSYQGSGGVVVKEGM